MSTTESGPATTESDFLVQTTASTDVDPLPLRTGVNTRFRTGYPRRDNQGSTVTDAKIARDVTAGIAAEHLPTYVGDNTQLPPLTDELLNVKRALQFKPRTGVSFTTGGSFSGYLRKDFDIRIVDGMAIFQAVDLPQSDAEASSDQKPPASWVVEESSDTPPPKPLLSYLRIGKPEKKVDGSPGDSIKDLATEPLAGQKFDSGIGIFTDGKMNTWARSDITFRAGKSITFFSDERTDETYGENTVFNYEYEEKDVEALNSGRIDSSQVNRKIVNVNTLRNTPLGWYRQVFDRGRNIGFSTSNKGDFSIGASYGMVVGAKFDHTIAAGLSSSFSGMVEVGASFKAEITPEGASFKHPFGSWTAENEASLQGLSRVELSLAGIPDLAVIASVKTYSRLLQIALLAQNGAFMLYNASLAGQADRTITPEEMASTKDNTHGLVTSLDQGIKIYEAALSLSAISCAAGLALAAYQASKQALKAAAAVDDPTVPMLKMSRTGITLKYGTSSLQITAGGIAIQAPNVVLFAPSLANYAQVNNFPYVPPPPAP